MKKTEMSELERINRTAKTAHLVVAVVMLLFCVLQTLSGDKSGLYLLTMIIFALVPVVAEVVIVKKNPESPWIKHLLAIGFLLFYTLALFTTTCSMVYVFIVPVVLIITLYNDPKYFLIFSVGTILENIVVVALGARSGGFGYLGMEAAVIQVVVMILTGVMSIYTSNTSGKNIRHRIDNLEEAHAQTGEVLRKTSEMTKQLEIEIAGINRELEQLNAASEQTKLAMEEVSSGAQNSAEAVQNQFAQTEAIQRKVEAVDEVASSMLGNMKQTMEVLVKGSRNMSHLMEQVDTSVKNSEEAATKLELLDGYMKEMHSIVEIISDITSQTSLLALNASIEAARAGEAGRGFAVVASEISGMATQTRDATANITGLIENVSGAIGEVVTVIRQMIDGIRQEKQGAKDSADSFARLEESAHSIQTNTENMMKHVVDLKAANQEIVYSIQTISAISEEVSAHAGDTLEAEQRNAEILERISAKMNDIVSSTDK